LSVKLAKSAGFCMGVRRAIEIVLLEANKRKGPIFTFGPIIHNRQVMELLETKGVGVIEDSAELRKGTLIIRAHGIPPQQRKVLKASGMRIIDATCPHVAHVQSIIRYHTSKGYEVILVGERAHPEVVGLVGYGNGHVHVIQDSTLVEALPEMERVIVVAQTTQDAERYKETAEAIRKRFPDAKVHDTICNATLDRQREVRALASHVDGLVVVGGLHSGNTRRLVQVAREAGVTALHVETEEELKEEGFSGMKVIGVTAGASTPNWMIRSVVQRIEAIQNAGDTPLKRFLRRGRKLLFLGNVMVSLGAFFLAYAAMVLMGRPPDLIHPLLGLLYIHAMYVLYRFLDKGASAYNDPERANFFRNHKTPLLLGGLGAMSAALVLSSTLGGPVLFATAGLCLLGMSYSIPVVPRSLRPIWQYSKIKDIPGSKTLSQALAWAALMGLLPLLDSDEVSWQAGLVSFLFVFAVVYVRAGLFDILDLQGDMIVGRETLPIAIGERRALYLLKGVIVAGALLSVLAPLVAPVSPVSFLFPLCFLGLRLTILAYEKRWVNPGMVLEAMMEGNLFLAGFLALAWNHLSWLL
jgi:(E)-4-hydroxy-3-methyl-but-2-enyl pyrophosphate reductase